MKKITIVLVGRDDLSFIGERIHFDLDASDFIYWKDKDGVNYCVRTECIITVIEEPVYSVGEDINQ